MRGRHPVMLLLVAVSLAGCGGSRRRAPAGAAELFRAQCSSCHTLSGHESARRQGGDLLGYRMTRAQLLQFIREMPTPRPLTPAQQHHLADYVLALQRRHATAGS